MHKHFEKTVVNKSLLFIYKNINTLNIFADLSMLVDAGHTCILMR